MYQIGQFRKSQLENYLQPLQMTMGEQETKEVTTEVIFYDICGNLTGENVVNMTNSYYLNFNVKQNPEYSQRFDLKLRNNLDQIEEEEQLLETFLVPKGIATSYFEIVFTPNNSYNQIVWELKREVIDFSLVLNNNNHYGRLMEVTVKSFDRIVDVMETLKRKYNLTSLKKIGIQGPPSMLMCINGEQIRNSRSGIYEINNDKIQIESIGFVPKTDTFSSNGSDYFTMDFEY